MSTGIRCIQYSLQVLFMTTLTKTIAKSCTVPRGDCTIQSLVQFHESQKRTSTSFSCFSPPHGQRILDAVLPQSPIEHQCVSKNGWTPAEATRTEWRENVAFRSEIRARVVLNGSSPSEGVSLPRSL
jgi:hypothetical protein